MRRRRRGWRAGVHKVAACCAVRWCCTSTCSEAGEGAATGPPSRPALDAGGLAAQTSAFGLEQRRREWAAVRGFLVERFRSSWGHEAGGCGDGHRAARMQLACRRRRRGQDAPCDAPIAAVSRAKLRRLPCTRYRPGAAGLAYTVYLLPSSCHQGAAMVSSEPLSAAMPMLPVVSLHTRKNPPRLIGLDVAATTTTTTMHL
jgi:hypothetical protein